jgi:S-adenosylmethionine hydrolase
MQPIITLTTDFGQREPFVAEVKGILFSGCPGIQVVDLGHDIGRGDVMEAALFVLRSIPRFPAGTLHLVNVAPGPDPIVVSVLGQTVVCPDNGVLTMLSHHHPIDTVHVVPIPESVTKQPGQVYFGRDVFAPVLARLAAGAAAGELGELREGMAMLSVARPERVNEQLISGQIIHTDRFGNLVTNIHISDLANTRVERVEAGGFPLGPLRQSYAEVPLGKPLALLGSAGYLEVAYNGDRADTRLDFGPGIKVRVSVSPATP